MTYDHGILCLTFDNMGHALSVGQGKRAGPDNEEVDLTVGYPKVLCLLDALGLKATFFIEGWNALHHPEAVKSLAEHGHEIGLHGWVHEVFHSLTAIDAERVLVDAQAAFRLIGIEPRGFRAPGGIRGPHTAAILGKLALQYDSSVDESATTMSPRLLEGGIPNIPWQWPLIDYYQYYMHPKGARTPEQLETLWSEQLVRAAEDRTLVTFIIHASVSGVDPSRLAVIERLLLMATSDPRLEVLTAGEVADRVRSRLLA